MLVIVIVIVLVIVLAIMFMRFRFLVLLKSLFELLLLKKLQQFGVHRNGMIVSSMTPLTMCTLTWTMVVPRVVIRLGHQIRGDRLAFTHEAFTVQTLLERLVSFD